MNYYVDNTSTCNGNVDLEFLRGWTSGFEFCCKADITISNYHETVCIGKDVIIFSKPFAV